MSAAGLARSNSLADLAARIKAEHEASVLSMKRGLTHAVNAGRLLVEAKAQLAHGQWLEWLREHCGVPERTAQRYMRVAAYAAEIKSDNLADFTADDGTAALISIEKGAEAGEWELVARLMLERPFCSVDFNVENQTSFGHDELPLDWLRTKLFYQIKVPPIAAWCFDVASQTENGRPALRLCPWDELLQAGRALAPVASADRKNPIKFDSNSFRSLEEMQRAITELQLRAMLLLGGLLNEMTYRENLGDDRYQREWTETHQQVMASLDAAVAKIERERAGAAEASP